MKYKFLSFVAGISILLSACKKQIDVTPNIQTSGVSIENKMLFSTALAASLENRLVRKFLKEEALKMFDKDYDVLYHLIKDKKLDNGERFSDVLASYADKKEDFLERMEQESLLTIFIPTLEEFDAVSWDINNEIPIVAIRDRKSKNTNSLPAVKMNGDTIGLSYRTKPKFPVIVVKDNERMILKDANSKNSNSINTSNLFIKNTPNGSLFFTDENFSPKSNTTLTQRNESSSPSIIKKKTDPKVFNYGYPAANGKHQAYFSYLGGNGSLPVYDYIESSKLLSASTKEHQRDLIYYNIQTSTGEGEYEESHVEFIHSISFNNHGSEGYVVDDTRDWTDGFLEIYVHIFFINRAGGLDKLLKIFSADANVLFESEPYVNKPRVYYLPNPVPIAGWDLYNLGDTWKFYIEEYDPGSTTVHTTNISTNHTTNWRLEGTAGLDLKIIKIGASGGGGASNSETKSSTVQVSVSGSSDNLGEGILKFSDKVSLGYAFEVSPYHEAHNIYTVNTGMVELGIVPKLKY